jgi:hypothetical protein
VVILLDSQSPVSSPPKHLSKGKFPNLHFARVNMSSVMEDTAVEDLWDSPRLARSGIHRCKSFSYASDGKL